MNLKTGEHDKYELPEYEKIGLKANGFIDEKHLSQMIFFERKQKGLSTNYEIILSELDRVLKGIKENERN